MTSIALAAATDSASCLAFRRPDAATVFRRDGDTCAPDAA